MENKKVYKILQSGTSYTVTNISYDLPNLPANSIVYQAGASDRLFVGTDVGVYYTQNCTGAGQKQKWVRFKGSTASTNLPNVSVSDLAIVTLPSGPILRAATFGRGIWETPLNNINTTCPGACTNTGTRAVQSKTTS